jgi:hypothetical protein
MNPKMPFAGTQVTVRWGGACHHAKAEWKHVGYR